jgi:hypothetical protein
MRLGRSYTKATVEANIYECIRRDRREETSQIQSQIVKHLYRRKGIWQGFRR